MSSSSEPTTTLSVLHVVTRNHRRGAESSAVELAGRLGSLGHRTQVVALAAADAGATLAVTVLGPTTLAPQTLWRLRGLIRAADVVVAHGSRTLPAVGIAGLGLGVPSVYQNIGDPAYWAGHPSRRFRVRRLLGRMSAVAALTRSAAETLVSDFGVPPDRVWVVPNWRDGEEFRPASVADRTAARASFGLPPDGPVAVMVGALTEEKDVDLALRAVGLLPDVRLVVAGDGPDRRALEARAEQLARGRVHFTGALTDVRPVLHAADVFLLTSASEGVPGVLIEAGLCRLPAVTTDVGFVRDVVEQDETGLVVADRRPESVASDLRRALEDGDRLGSRARERCLELYDTARVTRLWQDLLERVRPAC